ncbi:hypothetical protein J1792_29885 [Streptomyces triculaminicus]|uniref:Uncharacterized protein n=1 Tax=Streptomyces triculaminicus TaxID=2816232 RepID=A0A939FSX4_9ACTN|nr:MULTISPECIES: hypothetical protein [Streptomyces]MBO0656799.1 hypothetical protein [Streptomyces triculaminicus]
MASGISRRGVLTGAGAVALSAAVPVRVAAAAPVPEAAAPLGALSANGWRMERTVGGGGPVEGIGVTVALRAGDVETVLVHVVRRFHYEIAELGEGQVVGHLAPGRVPLARAGLPQPPESNHASGTAVAIRPDWYPKGGRGGFFPLEMLALRDVLAECEGVVRWGGDAHERPYEALFFLDVPPGDARLARVAAKIRGGGAVRPGAGPVDVLAPGRRAAALRLERRQRSGSEG